MSGSTLTNGKPRKQLSDQLDRLDGILDALADGLSGAVTDACREGARQAVKDAIIEVLTNPELRALIAPARPDPVPSPAPPTPLQPEFIPEPEKPGLWSRLKAKFAAARDAATNAARQTKEVVVAQYEATRDAVAAVGKATGEALPWKRVVWVSAGVGLVIGVICLVVPHTAAAAVGAVSAAVTSVAVQTGRWLKKAATRLGLV